MKFIHLACIACLFLVPATAWAQVAPPLGAAAQFGALGNSGVTGSAVAGTVVSGDVGSSPTPAISNFGPSTVASPFTLHLANDAIVQAAHTDAIAADVSLFAQVAGSTVLPDDMATIGVPLTSGSYSFTTGAALLPGSTTLTLNGPGVFVFNAASLTTVALSTITGTANPCNIYWRIGSSAVLNGNTFLGTVVAVANITISSADNVTGRLLAGTGATGAVTISGSGGNTIGGCSGAGPVIVAPTVTKAFTPAAVGPDALSTLTLTLANANATAATLTAAFTDTLPAGLVIGAIANASTTCGGAVTAVPGSTTVSLAAGSAIPAGGSCTVTVSVSGTTPATYVNTIAVNSLQTSNGNNTVSSFASLIVDAALPVPTLSQWATIALTLLLGLAGFTAMRRRHA